MGLLTPRRLPRPHPPPAQQPLLMSQRQPLLRTKQQLRLLNSWRDSRLSRILTHHMVPAIRINVILTSFATKKTFGLCSSVKLSALLSPGASMWPGAGQGNEVVRFTSPLAMARRTQGAMGMSASGPTRRRGVHVFGMAGSAEGIGRRTKTVAMQMLLVFGQDS